MSTNMSTNIIMNMSTNMSMRIIMDMTTDIITIIATAAAIVMEKRKKTAR